MSRSDPQNEPRFFITRSIDVNSDGAPDYLITQGISNNDIEAAGRAFVDLTVFSVKSVAFLVMAIFACTLLLGVVEYCIQFSQWASGWTTETWRGVEAVSVAVLSGIIAAWYFKSGYAGIVAFFFVGMAVAVIFVLYWLVYLIAAAVMS